MPAQFLCLINQLVSNFVSYCKKVIAAAWSCTITALLGWLSALQIACLISVWSIKLHPEKPQTGVWILNYTPNLAYKTIF